MSFQYQSKWATRTAAKIRASKLSKPDIRVMLSKISRAIYDGGYAGRGDNKQCTYAEACALLQLLEVAQPRIAATHAQQGAEYLYRLAFTPHGRQRNTKFTRELSALDFRVIAECRASPAFHLVGAYDLSQSGPYPRYAPIYRTLGKSATFDYVGLSWQAGQSFLVRHAQEIAA